MSGMTGICLPEVSHSPQAGLGLLTVQSKASKSVRAEAAKPMKPKFRTGTISSRQILLVNASHKTSPESKEEEIDTSVY